MPRNANNYSGDRETEENLNSDNKYDETGESEFTRESTIPLDQDEILSERHYTLGPLELHGRKQFRSREPRKEPESQVGKGPRNYLRSDERIKDDVSDALYRSTRVDASYITVFVEKGIVTLKGQVESREQKKAALDVIEYIPGVRDVFNDLRIKTAPPKPSRYGLIDNITGLN